MKFLQNLNAQKIYLTPFISLILVSIFFLSCSQDNSDDNPTVSPTKFKDISVTVNGNEICINSNSNSTKISGEGTVTTKTLTVEKFTGIALQIPKILTINQGTTQSVEVTGHPNIIAKIKTSVVDNILEIIFENGCYKDYQLSITITTPSITNITNGSGTILVNNFENQSELTLEGIGGGDITLNNFEGIKNLNAIIIGSGDINCTKEINSLNKLDVNISGSGSYSGFNLSSNEAEIDIGGSGDCSLTVKNKLTVKLTGSGNVNYKGKPANIDKTIAGTGSVNKTD